MSTSSTVLTAQRWLDHRLGESGTAEFDLDEVLADFVSQWPVPDLIDAFMSDTELLRALSRRTYRHSNGFDRIELISSTWPEFGLRLHVWWGEEGAKEHIHGHPWDFASKVLVGKLRVEQFVESISGDIVDVSEYDRPDGSTTYKLRHAGTTTLRRIFSAALPAGTNYFADHELLHRVWTAPGQPTVTLMLHGRGTAYPSRVFCPKGALGDVAGDHSREPPHMDLLLNMLRHAKALVSKEPTSK